MWSFTAHVVHFTNQSLDVVLFITFCTGNSGCVMRYALSEFWPTFSNAQNRDLNTNFEIVMLRDDGDPEPAEDSGGLMRHALS